MTILESIIQGAVQGLTEFLPVSSSGHLTLMEHFFNFAESDALFFMVMLHLGTLAAVLAAFWPTIWGMIKEFFLMIGDIFAGRFSFKKAGEERRAVIMLFITLIPLAACYFISDYIKFISQDNDIIVEGLCFLFTGTLLFIACQNDNGTRTAKDMTPKDAFIIGAAQCVATLPGVSRSGSTTAAGMLCGLSKEFAIKFSFIMGIPAILGASLSELKDALEVGVSIEPVTLGIGVLTAALTGFAAIKLVQWLMKTDRYKLFAYYTLALGSVVVIIGLIERFTGGTIADFIARFKA